MKKITKYTLFLFVLMAISIIFSGRVYAKACSEYSYSDCPKESKCVKDSKLKKCTTCEGANKTYGVTNADIADIAKNSWSLVQLNQVMKKINERQQTLKKICNTNTTYCMWQNTTSAGLEIGVCRNRPSKTSSDIDIIINKKTNFKCSDVKHLTSIWMFLRIVSPFLVVLFGSLDFIKAVIASDEKKMKESRGKFVKRLIAFVLLILLPFMIQFIFERIGTNGSQNMCLVKCITTNNTSSKGCD